MDDGTVEDAVPARSGDGENVADRASKRPEHLALAYVGRMGIAIPAIVAAALTTRMVASSLWAAPPSLGLGIYSGLAFGVGILGALIISDLPVSPLGTSLIAVLLLTIRAGMNTTHVPTIAGDLTATVLAVIACHHLGCALARGLGSGLWAIRLSFLAGILQFIYYRFGYGPGIVRFMSVSPGAPSYVRDAWDKLPAAVLEYGAQAVDLVFAVMAVRMVFAGKLRRAPTIAALVVAGTAVAILTSATGNPVPALPWLVALLYLFQAVEYDPLPPIERRDGPETSDDAAPGPVEPTNVSAVLSRLNHG